MRSGILLKKYSVTSLSLVDSLREYRRGNQNGQSRETGNIGYTRRSKTNQNHNTICVGHHYTQTNRNNVNKTWILLQTTGEKFEDTNEEIRIRKSKKDRKHNDQKKKEKQRSTKHYT